MMKPLRPVDASNVTDVPLDASRMRVWDGLSFKQFLGTLIIALIFGLTLSAIELANSYRQIHTNAKQDVANDFSLVRGLAVEAAYQLSTETAAEVVGGLAANEAVRKVTLVDNFGGKLGERQRPPHDTPLPQIAQSMFGDITRHVQPLEFRTSGGVIVPVGVLELELDPHFLFQDFLGDVFNIFGLGLLRAIGLCLAVVVIFYALITKPLLRVASLIANVNPSKPGATLIKVPTRNARDELGLLAGTLNQLLQKSQEGLDQRDRAQEELAALARELEQRVLDRTRELAREKEGVERALAQLNLANAELEKANAFINDGIRYASRIQNALLPDQGALKGIVEELAVGWQPLDIVGGDYYWAGTFGSKGVIAVMDCTGHGVPGAFMTAVVASSFNRILHHHGHDNPAEILAQLNRLVKSALRQDRLSAVSNDGLDAAICVVDMEAGTVTYSGANLPILMLQEGELVMVRGDRMSLGYLDSPEDYQFNSHTFAITEQSAFYLFTDGVTDQVGSEIRQLFGKRRLQQTLAEVSDRPLNDQMDYLFQELGRWRGMERRRDDMTFLAFRPKLAAAARAGSEPAQHGEAPVLEAV